MKEKKLSLGELLDLIDLKKRLCNLKQFKNKSHLELDYIARKILKRNKNFKLDN